MNSTDSKVPHPASKPHLWEPGDRVQGPYGTGTVVRRHEYDPCVVLVEHDKTQEFLHNGRGYGLEHRCWWFDELDLKPTEPTQAASDIDTILDTRAKTYGIFMNLAGIAQRIKTAMFDSVEVRKPLAPDQREALEMVASKIARIINGDPDCVDSWDDVAGYAKLVADRLRGRVR